MSLSLPDLYFRLRDNGATVFRLDPETRELRIELEQVAVVNVRSGEIRPQGDRRLTDDEQEAIRTWLAERTAEVARREIDDILRAVETLNLTAHWAQTRATEAQLDAVTNHLLLAMHDLRTVLVRKQAERMEDGSAT